MRRALAAARRDAELQVRNGLYAATAFVLLVALAGLAALPAAGLARLLPAVALNNLAVSGFFFSAAAALLERAEGSDRALLVTPLQPGEYLAARTLTLALLALAQHLALALLLLGLSSALLPFVAGVLLAAALLVLAGYAATDGRRTISDLLLPALPPLGLLLAPLVADVLEWRHPLLWLHPLQGPLVLMRAAVAPVAGWELVLALGLGLLWTAAFFALARRVYRRQLAKG